MSSTLFVDYKCTDRLEVASLAWQCKTHDYKYIICNAWCYEKWEVKSKSRTYCTIVTYIVHFLSWWLVLCWTADRQSCGCSMGTVPDRGVSGAQQRAYSSLYLLSLLVSLTTSLPTIKLVSLLPEDAIDPVQDWSWGKLGSGVVYTATQTWGGSYSDTD